MVGRVGIEPTANRLKAYCSTTELPTHDVKDRLSTAPIQEQSEVVTTAYPSVISPPRRTDEGGSYRPRITTADAVY